MKAFSCSTLALALLALPLTAQQGPNPGRQGHRVAQALQLTDAQKTSIKAIRDKHHPDLVVRRDAAKAAQISLQAALRDATISEANLRALHGKASAARLELTLARRSVHQEIQAVFTPEQRAKAAELQAVAQVNRRERLHHLRMAAGLAG